MFTNCLSFYTIRRDIIKTPSSSESMSPTSPSSSKPVQPYPTSSPLYSIPPISNDSFIGNFTDNNLYESNFREIVKKIATGLFINKLYTYINI